LLQLVAEELPLSDKKVPTIRLGPLEDQAEDRKAGETGAVDPEAIQGIRIRRFVAYAIDLVCLFVISILAGFAFVILGVATAGLLTPALVLFYGLIPLAYHTFFIGGQHHATPGMKLLGLEVQLVKGGHPDYVLAALHTIAFYVTMGLTSWLALVVSLFNAEGRLLHDFLIGSTVRRVMFRTAQPG
jgi:uncharacterized RDD family membrane protein YckC